MRTPDTSDAFRESGRSLVTDTTPPMDKRHANSVWPQGIHDGAHQADEDQGYEDALAGYERTSSRAWYRRGYDAGLSERIRRESQA